MCEWLKAKLGWTKNLASCSEIKKKKHSESILQIGDDRDVPNVMGFLVELPTALERMNLNG